MNKSLNLILAVARSFPMPPIGLVLEAIKELSMEHKTISGSLGSIEEQMLQLWAEGWRPVGVCHQMGRGMWYQTMVRLEPAFGSRESDQFDGTPDESK